MADVFSKEQRSWVMSRITGFNTTPERVVRSFLHQCGFRFRLHVSNLPGKPDIVLPKYRTIILVHGCFWHGHRYCTKGMTLPKTNAEFWTHKIQKNVKRDAAVKKKLKDLGWKVLVIWECGFRRPSYLEKTLHPLISQREA